MTPTIRGDSRPAALVVAIALAVFLGIVAVGCGGEDEGSAEGAGNTSQVERAGTAQISVSTSEISRDEYMRKAVAICARAGKKIIGGLSSGLSPNSKQFTKFSQTVMVPAVEQELSELEVLSAPHADKADIEAILQSMQSGVEQARTSRLRSIEDFGALFKDYDSLVQKYGMGGCAFRFV